MAPSADPLAPVAALKEYLDLAGEDRDALLERLIAAVGAACERFTGRLLMARDYSCRPQDAAHDPDQAILSGDGTPVLVLPQYPVQSLSLVECDGWVVTPAAGTAAPGWLLDRAAGVICLRGLVFGRGQANVGLVYRAGFETAPADLAHSVVEQAALLFQQSGAGQSRLGLGSRSLADGAVSYAQDALLPSVRAVWERHRQRSLA